MNVGSQVVRDIGAYILSQNHLVLRFQRILPGSWGDAQRRLMQIVNGAVMFQDEVEFFIAAKTRHMDQDPSCCLGIREV